eukprot:maker-scaffold_66-snap-gene-0.76-mRNA-1 protein AED:0.00 eAED:0.00 QI:119/1/1/1/1/1/4/53/387
MGKRFSKVKTIEKVAVSEGELFKSIYDDEHPNSSIKFGKIFKMLLYGPGECGKTTILRRMMLIQGEKEEIEKQLKDFRGRICYNVIEGAAMVLKALVYKYELQIEEEYEKYAQTVLDCENHFLRVIKSPSSANLEYPGIVEAIRTLYNKSKIFRKVLKKRTEYSLFENWKYFAKNLENYPAWGGQNWAPSQRDLLHSRIRTTGLQEVTFKPDETTFSLIDVGGQRAERRKFFFLFADMDCLIFVGSMADYDESLFEDAEVNRLTETLDVFEQTIKREEFKDTFIILFLNKLDLFREKYVKRKIPISEIPGIDLQPPKLEDEDKKDENKSYLAEKWFKEIFLSKIPVGKEDQVKPFLTSALEEKNNIQEVMQFCVNLIQNSIIPGAMI